MRVSDFDFELPEELIAQTPPETRGQSRMLRVDRQSGALADDVFASLPGLLRPGDVLVLNDSRVLPSRLYAVRGASERNAPAPTGKLEVLLTGRAPDGGPDDWNALVRPSRKVRPGDTLHFPGEDGVPLLTATVLEAGAFGERRLRFPALPDFLQILERIGHLPLPPYIHRGDTGDDRQRYQTVYAASPGSAAAPTAGLHFTDEILGQLRAREVEIHTLTLHVGLGTFQPVRVQTLAEISLHREFYTLPQATAAAINRARGEGRRVIAAGTTTTRTLEHCAAQAGDGLLEAHSGSTAIFLAPGHVFRVVAGLLTNFHLPQSTLLMLVSAFLGAEHGRERALAAYAHAVRERYRFFSYGDCMLIL